MKKMIAVLLLALVPGVASAAVLTKDEVGYCSQIKEFAEAVAARKSEGFEKSDLYNRLAAEIEEGETLQFSYLTIDFVYNGTTPSELFSHCIDIRRDVDK